MKDRLRRAEDRLRRTARPWTSLGTLAALAMIALLSAGCSTSHPPPVSAAALEEAETFPYYPIYWVGRNFAGQFPLTAVDGKKGYNSSIGDSVYYGDCASEKGVLGSGSCRLPLQVTTVIYRLHSNTGLGAQSNTVIRGVPAVIYEEGRAIELYSGRQAIDIFSDGAHNARQAAEGLRPLNAPGSAIGRLPLPVFCPGLSGAQSRAVLETMAHLPHHACQRAAAAEALAKRLAGV